MHLTSYYIHFHLIELEKKFIDLLRSIKTTGPLVLVIHPIDCGTKQFLPFLTELVLCYKSRKNHAGSHDE
jgi:hypothetical protein